jgi:hypothetical protein
MALLSVDKKIRYPDEQLEKPQRMQKSIAPPVRAQDIQRSHSRGSPVAKSSPRVASNVLAKGE